MVCRKMPIHASIPAARTCLRWVMMTRVIPRSAARKISRDPNIGAMLARTGARNISAMMEKTAP
jgi:hypothetical protein